MNNEIVNQPIKIQIMKKINLFLIGLSILICASLSLNAQTTNELNTINKDEIRIAFTTNYDFDDLVNVKNELTVLDIEIIYTSLKFDEKGRLSQISAKIEYPDGKKGSFTSRELEPNDGPGFRRKFTGGK